MQDMPNSATKFKKKEFKRDISEENDSKENSYKVDEHSIYLIFKFLN
jgi:hypothetical protein